MAKYEDMTRFGLRFHHFGLAVRDPTDAFVYLGALGYKAMAQVYDPLQGVNLAWYGHTEMPDIEVIWPAEGPSPIDSLLVRRDSMVYHLCYTANDPALSVESMEKKGLNVLPIGEPQPAVLFGGLEVSFYSIANVGLIEIIHGFPDRPGDG